MKQFSSERNPSQVPAARTDATASHTGPRADTSLEKRIGNSPRMVAQRQQLGAMADAPIQRMQRYPKSILERVQFTPDFTTTKVGVYTVPKRMLARPLALPNGPRTDKRETENTPLWKKLKSEQESIAFKDGHLLNHKFGGPADATNMVPISADANTQMSPFDGYVETLLQQGAVVDLEVSANYGRNDGLTSAQNAIPTSLDMRMIPQRDEGNAWVDDPDERVVVQNVVINLDSDSEQGKKAKRKSLEYGRRDQAWAKWGVISNAQPQATVEGPEQPGDELARKSEWDRQTRYQPFNQLPQWARWKQEQREKKRDTGARDIVSGNLVDSAWIGAQAPQGQQMDDSFSDSSDFEFDDSYNFEFDESELESYQIDALVSTSTHWLEKAITVQSKPGLIDKIRELGWTEVAEQLTQYLRVDLRTIFDQKL